MAVACREGNESIETTVVKESSKNEEGILKLNSMIHVNESCRGLGDTRPTTKQHTVYPSGEQL